MANRQAGNLEFRTDQDLYEFAPDAGMVRLFYLPRSRWAVNIELLPDVPADLSPEAAEAMLRRAGAAWRGHDKVGAAEARAEAAALEHGFESYFPDPALSAPSSAEPDALARAIIGSWSNPFLHVAFREDGTLHAQLADGSEHEGQWSVDPTGQLRATVMGAEHVGDASVEGAWLTLSIGGQAVRLQRPAGS